MTPSEKIKNTKGSIVYWIIRQGGLAANLPDNLPVSGNPNPIAQELPAYDVTYDQDGVELSRTIIPNATMEQRILLNYLVVEAEGEPQRKYWLTAEKCQDIVDNMKRTYPVDGAEVSLQGVTFHTIPLNPMNPSKWQRAAEEIYTLYDGVSPNYPFVSPEGDMLTANGLDVEFPKEE